MIRQEIYDLDKVFQNVVEMAKYAMERLNREFLPLPCVAEINGEGPMIGNKEQIDRMLDILYEVLQTV